MTTGSFQIQEKDIELLKGRWNTLAGRYTDDPAELGAAFATMVQHYSGRRRVYHNLSHIRALTDLYEELKVDGDCDAISFSIWYHDVIYDTRRKSNEDDSAKLACSAMARLGVPSHTIAEVEKMILATKDHSAENLSVEGKLFLDLDISILGAPADIYEEYRQAIRQEYDWVPWAIYQKGRREVLTLFSERRRVFITDGVGAKFENQARLNLRHELEGLAP